MIRIGGDKDLPSTIETYPGYGYQNDDGNWRINVCGIAYQTPPFTLRQKMILKVLGNAMQASESELECQTFQDRVWPFFVGGDKGIRIYIKVGNEKFKLKKKTRKSGRFYSWPQLPNRLVEASAEIDSSGRRSLAYEISTSEPEIEPVAGRIKLLSRTGVSIISDIDDTIKDSSVTNRRELLKNTFLNEFKAIKGMSDVYQRWHDAGAEFHYVSSSPWQLYTPLQKMTEDFGFPTGTMHLRNFRLRDQLLKKVMIGRRKGKAAEIKKLLKNLPHRKFILIGDSGEKDPEIYCKARRKNPEQVAGLFIREIKDRPIDSGRIEKLKKGKIKTKKQVVKRQLREICQVFRTPDGLEKISQPVLEQLQMHEACETR